MESRGFRPPEFEPGLYCARCGYDLRGARTGGSCPECGLAVEASRAFAAGLADPSSGRCQWLGRVFYVMAVLFALMGLTLNLRINPGAGWQYAPWLLGAAFYGGGGVRCLLLLGLLACVWRSRRIAVPPAAAKAEATLPWVVFGFVVVQLATIVVDYSWWIVGSRRVSSMLGSAWGIASALLYVNRVLWPVSLGAIVALVLGLCRRVETSRGAGTWVAGKRAAWVFAWGPISACGVVGLWIFAEACVGRAFGRAVGELGLCDALSTVASAYCAFTLALAGRRLRTARVASGASANEMERLGRSVLVSLRLVLLSVGALLCVALSLGVLVPRDRVELYLTGMGIAALMSGAAGLVTAGMAAWRLASVRPRDISAALRLGDARLCLSAVVLGFVAAVGSSLYLGSSLGVASVNDGAFGALAWIGVVLTLIGVRSSVLGISSEPETSVGPVAILWTAVLASVAYILARGTGSLEGLLQMARIGSAGLLPTKSFVEGIVYLPAIVAIGTLLIDTGRARRRFANVPAGGSASAATNVS